MRHSKYNVQNTIINFIAIQDFRKYFDNHAERLITDNSYRAAIECEIDGKLSMAD